MYAFESGDEGFRSYGEALWWTAMLVTSIGSEFWPQTAEGRILCLIISIYGFAIFGYVTATLASLFVGQDAKDKAASAAAVESLRAEIAALHADMKERHASTAERRVGKEGARTGRSRWAPNH